MKGARRAAILRQIDGDRHHADGVAWLQWTVKRHLARARAHGTPSGGDETLAAERAAEKFADLGLEARHHERRGDGTEQRADFAAGQPGDGAHALKLGI